MNCTQCGERLVDYVESILGPEAAQVEAHLRDCPACRAELEALQRLCGRLRQSGQGAPAKPLDGRVMDQILTEQAAELRRLKMRTRYKLFGVGAATAAAMLLVVLFTSTRDPRAMAAEALAQAATQASGLKLVHLKCRMRTLPRDNFSLIGPEYEFVELDVWQEFGSAPKYRIEKPGRVLVCDGESTVMLMKPDTAVKGPAGANFDAAWLRDLADVQALLSGQLREALATKTDLSLKHVQDAGKTKVVITIESKAGEVGDYLRNKFLNTSDTRRVFRFDDQSKRLEEMKIVLHAKDGDVPVFEVTAIEYDPQLPASTFTLELPKDVTWHDPTGSAGAASQPAGMTPKQVAEAFFAACAKEDWDEARKYWSGKVEESTRKIFGGLAVVSIGEPFQSKPFPGWFVPYEIKFKSGGTKKFNMVVRNDNPAKRWLVDGGL